MADTTNPNNETERLLDAATRRIGNEPDNGQTFDDFEDADSNASENRSDLGSNGRTGGNDTPVQDERSTDGLGVENTGREDR